MSDVLRLILPVILACCSIFVFWMSFIRSKADQFYSDTLWLIPMGIFVWGDGLILAPFWFLSSILFLFLSPLNILRFFLLFYALRSAYEVIYWINHQVAQKDYRPPLFRRVKWIGPNEAAILYQLLNMCWVVLTMAVLIWSWI